MQNIYLLFSCNEWKEHGSMRTIMATTDEEKLVAQIKKEIKEGNMKFDGLSGNEAISAFEADDDLDYNRVDYGYVSIVEDGEV